MKKFFSILILSLLSLLSTSGAFAYSQEMEEFAKLMNEETDSNSSVSYDGTNIIINFSSSFFSPEEIELFSSMDDLQPMAPLMVEGLRGSMDAQSLDMMASLLDLYDTNLVIRLQLGNKTKDIFLTPQSLKSK